MVKDICKKCFGETMGGWHHMDEDRWAQGQVLCPHTNEGAPPLARVEGEIPTECRYYLEQWVLTRGGGTLLVNKEKPLC